jgi:Tol biopolymer transport system component/predicted Ser/Thr protein kinase
LRYHDKNTVVGQTVANYRIVEELGAGGMGVVYKAQDIRLNRFLALKFLKPERVTEDYKRRFFQEARSASALNHPGIIHIYDIGQWEGADFIAMEFVEGSTLYQVLRARKLPLEEALRIAVQVADALMAAHAAGIVHRDLKPGNVMVTPAGLVKVLDFGLAKLNEPAPAVSAYTESASTQTLAYSDSQTQPGMVFGSPPYMSPEQALGHVVDPRSDIFAFGLLLYELLTGHPAFKGKTKIEVLSAVLHVDPPPPSKSNRQVSKALDAVVARCLRKNPEERFQSMVEVKQALESVGRRPATPRWLLHSAVVAALIATVAVIFLAVRGRHIFAPPEQAPAETVRLTNDPGLNIDPAISPDGTLAAYASDRSGEGNLAIWVKQVAGGEPLRVTHDSGDDSQPDFSPDGTQIVFRSTRDGGGLYMVPAMGGPERKIADNGRRPKFSPDGSKIAWWAGVASPFPLRAGNAKVFIFDRATSSVRELRPDFAAAAHPVWSPDGTRILFVGLKDANDLKTGDWWIAPVDGGAPVRCPTMPSDGSMLDPFAWRGDRVYFASGTRDILTIGEIRIDPKTGSVLAPPRRSTTGTSDEASPGVSKAGLVVFSSLSSKRNVYRVPLDPNTGTLTGERRALTEGISNTVIESVSADGKRIANLSNRTGQWEVWVKDLSNGRELQLTTSGKDKTDARITPDGNAVAWREDDIDRPGGFLTSFDGSSTRRLCADCLFRIWVPDGKLGLITRKSGRVTIGILDAASGEEWDYLAAPGMDYFPRSISLDGKWLAFSAHRAANDFTIYAAPFAPHRPPPQSEWIAVLASPDAHPNPHWSPDGGVLYFSSDRDGHNCVWAQKLDRITKHPVGPPFAVAHFHARSAAMTAPSAWLPVVLAPDALLVTLQERSGQIWMLKPSTGKP